MMPHRLPQAHCFKCDMVTDTVYIILKGGVGNCCSVCHTCRKGRPYVGFENRRYAIQLMPTVAKGAPHDRYFPA
jgi:hypothetical protein